MQCRPTPNCNSLKSINVDIPCAHNYPPPQQIPTFTEKDMGHW